MGGLHVIGSERHEARRIDLQLRGRCGRQGDPGSSRFYLSLEDDLMRNFAGEWVKNVLTRLGMQEGEAIESRMVSRRIEGAQKKVEERNFETRKNLLEYDEVMDEQRKRVYGYRQRILDGANCKQLMLDMIRRAGRRPAGSVPRPGITARNRLPSGPARSWAWSSTPATSAAWISPPPATTPWTRPSGRPRARCTDAMEENLPGRSRSGEWNWEALAKTANTHWRLSLRDRDLKQVGRDGVGEMLIEKAREAIPRSTLPTGREFLEPDYGVKAACAWVNFKFGIGCRPRTWPNWSRRPSRRWSAAKAEAAYHEKEVDYPVMAGLYHFTTRDPGGHKRYDREGLAAVGPAAIPGRSEP